MRCMPNVPCVLTHSLTRSLCLPFQCSLHECSDEEWNYKETALFHSNWGQPAMTIPCFHDPSDPHRVIATRTSFSSMLQAVLWSCLCLGIGAIVWIGLCLGFCTIKTNNYDQDIPLNPKGHGSLAT